MLAILISDAIANIAPAPTHIPSMEAIIGFLQLIIALITSPVIRGKFHSAFIAILTSGPIISFTLPPEQKFPLFEPKIIA